MGFATVAAAVLLLAGALLTGCGSDDHPSSPAPDYEKALAGAPAPLAALHRQSGELLDGGQDAFEQRLEELEGFPVVVNVWASWCGPCLTEFPHFQQASARMGKKVAFLAVDYNDNVDSAATFLRDNSVPYPSYKDPDRDIASTLGVHALPGTAFFNAEGEKTFTKIGPYTDTASLRADIERHAIGG